MEAKIYSNLNMDAYRRLKSSIARSYAAGWFVGVADDQIVGAAATFPELVSDLRSRGIDARRVLVVEAGIDYPEYVTVYI